VEAFPTAGFTDNDGNVTDDDTDGDGVLDVFDSSPGHGADFTAPEDTDSDGTPDFLDLDSDNDGTGDIIESGLTLSGNDNDGDGIDDAVGASFADPNGIVNNPSNDLGNQTGDTSEVGFREVSELSAVELTKEIIAATNAASGITGNFDVTYQLVLENTGDLTLDDLRLTEDLATQFGGAFVGISGTPTISAGPGSVVPGVNPNFDGGITDANIFDGTSGEIEAGEFILVNFVAEVNPNSPTAILNANDELVNQAIGGGDDTNGNSLSDFSDDPTNANDNDLNGDGNADDPTVVAFFAIDLIKSAGPCGQLRCDVQLCGREHGYR